MYLQMSGGGSVKDCEVEMVGEECEVYCEDGRRRVAAWDDICGSSKTRSYQ